MKRKGYWRRCDEERRNGEKRILEERCDKERRYKEERMLEETDALKRTKFIWKKREREEERLHEEKRKKMAKRTRMANKEGASTNYR